MKIKDSVISKINGFVHSFEIEFYHKFIEAHLVEANNILIQLYQDKTKEFSNFFENMSNITNTMRQIDEGNYFIT